MGTWQIEERTRITAAYTAGSRKQSNRLGKGRGLEWHSEGCRANLWHLPKSLAPSLLYVILTKPCFCMNHVFCLGDSNLYYKGLDMVAQVLRAEGGAPQRANMESWQEYRDLRGRATGLISAEGDQWLKMRKVLRQKILKPEDVSVFSGPVNEVITDLIKRIHTLRRQEEDGETVTDVNNLFFKYSMEGVATILYECRLGCLENNVPEKTVEYIEALALMFSVFKTAMYAGVIPKWLRPLIPKPWNVFCRSWDGLFKFSKI
uniref:Cytochrome P450 family 27 subfamily C member 1 n=1 Tax=Crocodylus porosus TaxID=8502 RepID=A0A7M4DWN7_CROPO